MRRLSLQRSSRSFIVLSALVIGAGLAVLPFGNVPVPLLLPFLPSILLMTSLAELSAALLIGVMFTKVPRRELFILTLVMLGAGLLDLTGLLTRPLPGFGTSLIPGAARAAPYGFFAGQALLAIGVLWFSLERYHGRSFPRGEVRRLVLVVLPLAGLALVAGCVALVVAGAHLPELVTGGNTVAYRRGLGIAGCALTMTSLVASSIYLGRVRRRWLSEAAQLTLLAAAMSALTAEIGVERYHLAWVSTRILLLISSTFVLVGAIRFIVRNFSEGLRIDADALRAEATAFEQNAAVEASLVKSRFVAMVSHELRTPLGGIIGMAELLQRSELNHQQRYYTDAIRTSADSLLRIVNDLLDFSRVESGSLELEARPFDIARLVEDVVTLFRLQARKKGIALHTFVDPSLPATITGDETRVKQVLLNLLNNAVRFTDRGTIRVDVTAVRNDNGGHAVHFSVADTGMGIAPHAQERIFNPFVQADASTARRFGGTGLGLAIARHLVELMGGRMTLSSILEVGSTFTFTIPFEPAATVAGLQSILHDLTVLVIEPDPVVRTLLKRYVEGWEMRADLAASTAAARAETSTYAVVILGPGNSRDEALAFGRARQSLPGFARADVILMCDDAGSELPNGYGIDAVLPGPPRQSRLFDAIARLRLSLTHHEKPAPATVARRAARTERILVAEDNEVNQALLVAQLQHLGLDADVVDNGEAAVAAALAQRYDLIFMDCQMPGVDGFEAARRIRSFAGGRDAVPIVAVTANVLPGYREICLAAGMNDYLAKPALIAPLTAIVDRWLPARSPVGPAASSASNDEPAQPPATSARRRLLEIFKGDEHRVDETIALALVTLDDAESQLRLAFERSDGEAAARLAHKSKGIAMEIGLTEISDEARRLEDAVRGGDWLEAEAALIRLGGAIESERALSNGELA